MKNTDKMTITEFITNCVKCGIEFELTHYEINSFDEYCLHIILGNHEHIIPTWDRHKLANLWYRDILEYHIY